MILYLFLMLRAVDGCIPELFKGFSIISDTVITDYYRSIGQMSRISCGSLCLSDILCKSFSYRSLISDCRLSVVPLGAVPYRSETSPDWTTYSSTSDEWFLVFQGVSDIGTDVYDSWLNGNQVTTDDAHCMTPNVTSCSNHYRHPLVESWSTLPIKEVKFSLYTSCQEVAYMTSDGTGSSLTSWFAVQNLLNHSWTDLQLNTLTYEHFSAQGFDPSRRFLIALSYAGCNADWILTMVVTSGTHPCNYDQQPSFPRFLFSTSMGFVLPETGPDVGFADSFTISVRF